MSSQYRLIVFDWEGTLGDTLGQILNTVAHEAKRLGFGELDAPQARRYVVLGLAAAVGRLFPHLSHSQQEQLLLAVHESLASRSAEVYLLPGARQIVEQIHQAGLELAIASNKGHTALQRVLSASGLDVFFHLVRCAGQAPPKPNPQMLEEIMAYAGVAPEETLMVGDSIDDIEMAKAAGVNAIGVDFYGQQQAVLERVGALAVFQDYKQLACYLQLPGCND